MSQPRFIPSKKFTGPKEGFVFKSGFAGLGYYTDKLLKGGTGPGSEVVETEQRPKDSNRETSASPRRHRGRSRDKYHSRRKDKPKDSSKRRRRSKSSDSSSATGSNGSSSESETGSEGSDSEVDNSKASKRKIDAKASKSSSDEANARKDDMNKEQQPDKMRDIIPTRNLGRTGGVYVPPFKMRQQTITDKSSEEYQRMTWMALRKGINGLVNKVNVPNIKEILPDLFELNLIRGRGLFARSLMKAQLASPGFTHIYVALLAVVNTKLPENGELVVKRVVSSFLRAFKRNDKMVATSVVKFIAHLVNRQVANEILALEVIALLLQNPTDDSVMVAIEFVKEVGAILEDVCPQAVHGAFEGLRTILHEGEIGKQVQYMIEGLFAIRRSGFEEYPSVLPELDLVESSDQITHLVRLDDPIDKEEELDVFRKDDTFQENEELWKQIRREVLGEEESSSSSESGSEDGSEDGSSSGSESDHEAGAGANQAVESRVGGPIADRTEKDLVDLRRTIYLTIMSSADFEECCHKLRKINILPGEEIELCKMLIECCSQERTYLKFYGLVGQRFCLISREYQESFAKEFAFQYGSCQRLDTNKLRNVAKFFSHLLETDALPWTVFDQIQLNEDVTTSSSRIFVKILCQELAERLGLGELKRRFMDPSMQESYREMFPKDNLRHTRFAINFFTSIGLGGLTDDLREHLANAPRNILQAAPMAASSSESSSSSSSSDSSSSGSDSSSSGSDSSSSGSSSGSDSSSSSSDSSSSDSESSSSSASSTRRGRRRRDSRYSRKRRSRGRRRTARSRSPRKERKRSAFRDDRAPKQSHQARRIRARSSGASREERSRKTQEARRRSPSTSQDERSPRKTQEARRRSPSTSQDERAPRKTKEARRRSPSTSQDERAPRKTKKSRRRSPSTSQDERAPRKTKEARRRSPRAEQRDDRTTTARGRSSSRSNRQRSAGRKDENDTRGNKSEDLTKKEPLSPYAGKSTESLEPTKVQKSTADERPSGRDGQQRTTTIPGVKDTEDVTEKSKQSAVEDANSSKGGSSTGLLRKRITPSAERFRNSRSRSSHSSAKSNRSKSRTPRRGPSTVPSRRKSRSHSRARSLKKPRYSSRRSLSKRRGRRSSSRRANSRKRKSFSRSSSRGGAKHR